MVHQTKNSQKFSEQMPFDVLLRAQVRRAAEPLKLVGGDCADFDADTVSAYLERALLSNAHQAFEAHIADCTKCRRQVTALMMLNAQLAPTSAVEEPAQRILPQVQPSIWSRYLTRFNEWRASFDLNWGLASAGAVTAALLLTATVYQWQMHSETNKATLANVTRTPEVLVDNPTAAPPSNQPLMAESTVAPLLPAGTLIADSASISGAVAGKMVLPGPTPLALPNLADARPQLLAAGFTNGAESSDPIRVIEIPEESVAFNSSPASAPTVPLTANRDFLGSNLAGGVQGMPVSLSQTGNAAGAVLRSVRLNSMESSPTVNSLNVVKDQLERKSRVTDLVATDVAAPASDNSHQNDGKVAKNEPGRTRALISALTKPRTGFGFMASKGDDARTKEAEKTTEEPLAKPLTKRVNGHTFYFERGYWIDENYRSDTTMPLIKLSRGTDRYQNLLIENPTLEQFFQLGQVIVVWKGKVYEVRK